MIIFHVQRIKVEQCFQSVLKYEIPKILQFESLTARSSNPFSKMKVEDINIFFQRCQVKTQVMSPLPVLITFSSHTGRRRWSRGQTDPCTFSIRKGKSQRSWSAAATGKLFFSKIFKLRRNRRKRQAKRNLKLFFPTTSGW